MRLDVAECRGELVTVEGQHDLVPGRAGEELLEIIAGPRHADRAVLLDVLTCYDVENELGRRVTVLQDVPDLPARDARGDRSFCRDPVHQAGFAHCFHFGSSFRCHWLLVAAIT